MKRRLLSLILAVCLMVGLCIPAWATTGISSDGGSVNVTLTGTAEYSNQLIVSLPTTIAFSLDPTKTVTASNPRAQVTGGEFTVLNYSSGYPLYLYVSDMSYNSSEVDFTTSLSDISDSSKKIYCSIYSEGDTVPDFTSSTLSASSCIQWCTNGTGYKFLVTASPITAGSASTPTSRQCYVAARGGLGFSNGDSFTITLTFYVSTYKSIAPGAGSGPV